MKVLFIGKRFYTNRDALREGFGRIYQLPLYWSKSNIQSELWLIDYHSGKHIRAQDEALSIESTAMFSGHFFIRLLSYTFARRGKFDVVVGSGDPYIGLVARHLARRQRARFVFDVYDKYDEFESYFRPAGFDLFRYLLKRADVRLFASKSLLEELGTAGEIDFLVPNGVDENLFRPLDMQECRHSLRLPGDVRFVGYFGSMEPARGIDDLIEAIDILRVKGRVIELLIGGQRRENLELSRPGIRYVGNAGFDQVPLLIASCDVVAIPYRRSAFMDAGSSNKIAEAMACQRPLVVTDTPNFCVNFPEQLARLSGRIAHCGDAADIARVIELQLEDPVMVTMPRDMSWRSIAANLASRLGIDREAGIAGAMRRRQ